MPCYCDTPSESDLINGGFWSLGYENNDFYFHDKNLAEAMAKMLIDLIENKLIDM